MKIELGEEAYRITDGDAAGELVEYGEVALLETGGKVFAAFLNGPEEAFDEVDVKVYRLEPVATDTEEVDFEESDEGDDSDSEEDSEESGEDED